MSDRLDPEKETASWQDIMYSNMIQTEALAQILVEKGLMTTEEFRKKIEQVHKTFMQQHPHYKTSD
ncbi:MAG: hypothetical protein ACQEQX_03745 [Thermodesulfobacteriota bacterium]